RAGISERPAVRYLCAGRRSGTIRDTASRWHCRGCSRGGWPMSDEDRPLLRVVRGSPTDEELAALTAVLAAKATPAPRADATPRSGWRNRAALLRRPLYPGRDAWRTSARPH